MRQKAQLVGKLTLGHGNRAQVLTPLSGNQRTVEGVPTQLRLIGEPMQISPNSLYRLRMRTKPNELRMIRVPSGEPAQHFLRKQALTPARDQGATVKKGRVGRPNTHPSTIQPQTCALR